MTGRSVDRGLSTGASLLVVFAGLFLALGSLYTATSNTVERLRDAESWHFEHAMEIQRTAINVSDTRLVDGVAPCEISLLVNNTGATTLRVNDTDLLLDGTYRTGWEPGATVENDPRTDVWQPGETLNVTVGGLTGTPDRAKFVTGPGVADTKDIDDGLVCS